MVSHLKHRTPQNRRTLPRPSNHSSFQPHPPSRHPSRSHLVLQKRSQKHRHSPSTPRLQNRIWKDDPSINVGTIPAAIVGLIYVQFLEDTLQQLFVIGATFITGATLVYISKIGRENTDNVTYQTALIMGVAQGLAIFPGLSRSGATISVALLLGLKRERAFKFSFLLPIPAILGDTVVEAFKNRGQIALSGMGYPELLLGVAVAMIVGYITIRLVSQIVASQKFHYFAMYTWLLGITLIVLTLTGH